jgi:RND family efflux transporter MFP subunit
MSTAQKATLTIVNLAILGIAAALLYHRFEEYVHNPWTRDGQVRAQVIQVSPRVSGQVTKIHVVDNQFVHKGDPLFEIDPSTYQTALGQAQANLERQQTSARGAQIEFERLRQIARRDRGAVSQKDLNRREVNYLEALSRIDVASEQLTNARLNLDFTRVSAPVEGYISNINFQIGSQAVANTPIVALVDSNSFWVFGYFRESEIGHIEVGAPARVTLMAYPDRPLRGEVESLGWGIAPSDGTVGYNLLPSVNPVFQWIRLAQRMPVRVRLDPLPAGVALRFGMSASVMVMAQEH